MLEHHRELRVCTWNFPLGALFLKEKPLRKPIPEQLSFLFILTCANSKPRYGRVSERLYTCTALRHFIFKRSNATGAPPIFTLVDTRDSVRREHDKSRNDYAEQRRQITRRRLQRRPWARKTTKKITRELAKSPRPQTGSEPKSQRRTGRVFSAL